MNANPVGLMDSGAAFDLRAGEESLGELSQRGNLYGTTQDPIRFLLGDEAPIDEVLEVLPGDCPVQGSIFKGLYVSEGILCKKFIFEEPIFFLLRSI